MADRQYELVYILPPDTTEQQVAEVQAQVEAIVSRLHGQIANTENWGRKRLAYEIARHKEGVYVLQVINGSGELMKELDRRLKVMDIVIRQMIVRVDEEKKVVDRTRTRRADQVGAPARQARPAAAAAAGRRAPPGERRPDDDRFEAGEV